MRRVETKQYPGIACYVRGPERLWEPYVFYGTDDDGNEFEYSEPGGGEWIDGDGSRLRVVMVGDDHEFVVDADECRELKEGDYCIECGQLGCMHGRSEDNDD